MSAINPKGLALAARSASLPVSYIKAKTAIAQCERMDECAEWANRAEAMASYYRQSKDLDLELQAKRIRLRAKRRLGELLSKLSNDVPKAARGRTFRGGQSERTRAASAIGITRDECKGVVRLARMPADVCEAKIEATPPASMSEMIRSSPSDPKYVSPGRFCASEAYMTLTRSQNSLAMFSWWVQKHPATPLLAALNEEERARCMKHVAVVRQWLNEFTSMAAKREIA